MGEEKRGIGICCAQFDDERLIYGGESWDGFAYIYDIKSDWTRDMLRMITVVR